MIQVIKPEEAKFDISLSNYEENIKRINRAISESVFHHNTLSGTWFIVKLTPYDITEQAIQRIVSAMQDYGWQCEFSKEYYGSPCKAIKFRTDKLNPQTVKFTTEA